MTKSAFAWKLSPGLCIPFGYAQPATTVGSRIGGVTPQAAIPQFETPFQKYFGTLEFDADFAISIFYSFEIFGESSDRDILKFHYQVLQPSSWIHAVVHPISGSTETAPIPAEVTCHQLQIGESEQDLEEVEVDLFPWQDQAGKTQQIPNPDSKCGGVPYVEHAAHVAEKFAQLAADGYRQLVQFGCPNRAELDYVERFPWDPGWLHVFVRGELPAELEFAFLIQY